MHGMSAMHSGHDVHPEESGHDGNQAQQKESAAKGGCGMAHESCGHGILPPDGDVGRDTGQGYRHGAGRAVAGTFAAGS
jgi:hypothetical protein